MHAQQYDFALGAGQSVAIEAVGEYVKVLSCTGPVRIELDTGPRLDALAGQGVRKEPFTRVQVTDKSGAANTGKILIAYGEMIDDRITGEVSVIDGGKARTYAGQAFSWANGQLAQAAAYSACQIYNPPGSGKNLVVKAYAMASSAAGVASAHVRSSSLANLQSAIPATKLATGTLPVAQSRTEALAAPSASQRYIDYAFFQAAGTFRTTLQEPVVVPPGYGFTIESGTQNVQMNAVFEWIEEPV